MYIYTYTWTTFGILWGYITGLLIVVAWRLRLAQVGALLNGEQQQSKHKLPKELKGRKSCFVNDNHNSAGNTYIVSIIIMYQSIHIYFCINVYIIIYTMCFYTNTFILSYFYINLSHSLSLSLDFHMHPLTSVDGLRETFACWDSGGPLSKKFLLNQTTQNTSLCHIPKMLFQTFQ